MESMKTAKGHLEYGKGEIDDSSLLELSDLQLALVGGGSGDVTLS
jgi:hypothetical protein